MTDILPPAGWSNVRQLETNEFASGGANGNMNEQAKSLAARSELLKRYAALPYGSKAGGYALNERVQLATGDIVRSTIASNVNNPNVDMTGWKVPSLKPEKNLSDVPDKAAARSNLSVYSQAQVDTAISNATPTIPNATGTVAGKVKINNTLNSTATDAALTAAQGKVLQDNKLETTFAFGVGQSMQDVTSSRAVNTTYTNSTGKPIIVNITWSYSGGGTNYANFLVNGTFVAAGVNQSGSGVSVVVPNGCTYRFSSAGWVFSSWVEYR